MKEHIFKIEDLVMEVMKENPLSRKDDFLLIYLVYRKIDKGVSLMDFSEVMVNHKKHGFPSFHTISRARRKIFEKHPEMNPKRTKMKREELEEEFKEYARV